MESNQLSDFTTYIRNLCRSHVEILHSDTKKHFIELNNDEQLQTLKHIAFPLVTMDKLTVSYTGQEDSLRKSRYCELMFLDKVNDTGNFTRIQEVKNKMEGIAEDFLKKFKVDRKNRSVYPFLKCLELSNMELNFVENQNINMYGVLLSFNFSLPFIESLDPDVFDNNVLFPPTPES